MRRGGGCWRAIRAPPSRPGTGRTAGGRGSSPTHLGETG